MQQVFNMLSPIIFLDCDGVVNNWHSEFANSGYRVPYVAEKNLVEILKRFCEETNALIVLSSTWRITISKEELKEIFGGWIQFHLISGNSWKTGRDAKGFRGNEIEEWFKDNPNFANYRYVILDDDSDFHPHQPHVKINSEFGLTPDDINSARELLKKPIITND